MNTVLSNVQAGFLCQKYRNSGFSLIEILVAISVLAILVGLLFRTIENVRDNALEAQCVANIRVYGSAVLSKLAADGRLPYWDGLGSSDSQSGKPRWDKWLVPEYLGELPRCPLVGPDELESGSGFHYTGNSGLLIYFSANPLAMAVPMSRVVLATESAGKDEGFNSPTHFNMTMWGVRDTDAGANINESLEGNARRPQYHGKGSERGMNLFFLDGSVKRVTPMNMNWWRESDRDYYFFWRDHFRRISLGRLP